MSEIEQEGLISRWSRRKLQTQEESLDEDKALLEDPAEVANIAIVNEAGVEPEAEPVLTDDDMPPIETLDEDSDFSVFMSSGVSDKLRNLALRKMFQVPSFNIRDGLDEYDEDFTTFEKLGDIVTCDMKHQIEMQEQKKKEAAEEQAALDQAEEEAETVVALDEEESEPEIEEILEPDDEEQIGRNDAI